MTTYTKHPVIPVEEEMRSAYIDYAMSVIIGRALPDVRDGLKPVHRRILYAMFREGLLASKKYSKCAGVVGEVLKKYHPHGDSAVYDALVRMAQEWNLRYPLVDGQGNFGSIDGDNAAAYRYTECRLTKIAEEMLGDIDKETVDWVDNFDETTAEPEVLPSRVPNLLVNGSAGIAVGMATNVPPHNLTEICNALTALIDDPELRLPQLMQHVPGPDFPTGAFIHGTEEIRQAYETGRGILQLRARTMLERNARTDREAIIVTEVPYQVNKAKLIESMANLVRDKKVEGISDLRDESDRDGMRVVIELKKDAMAEVVLNQLYKHTAMQTSFGIIFLAIDHGQPRVMGLKDLLQSFVDFRESIVTKRCRFELNKAEARLHILEGLKIALDHLDEVIKMIRASKDPASAKAGLMETFELSELQSQAILDMRLQRLTALERDKVLDEIKELKKQIAELKRILGDRKNILKVVKDELVEIRDKYGDNRRTEIIARHAEIGMEDLIVEEDMVVTVSRLGYIKRNAVSLYRAQRRGGRGKVGASTREGDFIKRLFVSSTHDYVLFFSDAGKVYWLKVYELPQAGRAAKGKAIVNLLAVEKGESIASFLNVRDFEEGRNIIQATRQGIVKKSSLMDYSRPRRDGIIAMNFFDGDALIDVACTDGNQEILLGTRNGKTIRFKEEQVRVMGRTSKGVRGIDVSDGDELVGMEVLEPGATILTVCENGYGKRTDLDEYPVRGRGGKGVITIKTNKRNGRVVGFCQVFDDDEVMLVTNRGRIIRLRMSDIRVIGRNTAGVRLFNCEEDEQVVGVEKLAEKGEENGDGDEAAPETETGEGKPEPAS